MSFIKMIDVISCIGILESIMRVSNKNNYDTFDITGITHNDSNKKKMTKVQHHTTTDNNTTPIHQTVQVR